MTQQSAAGGGAAQEGGLTMTVEAIRGYIDETLTAAASGEPGELFHAAKHLLGIPAAQMSPLDSERRTLLYFLSNYATAKLGEDEDVDGAAGAERLTDREVGALCEYAVEHPQFIAADFAIRRLERSLYGF